MQSATDMFMFINRIKGLRRDSRSPGLFVIALIVSYEFTDRQSDAVVQFDDYFKLILYRSLDQFLFPALT